MGLDGSLLECNMYGLTRRKIRSWNFDHIALRLGVHNARLLQVD